MAFHLNKDHGAPIYLVSHSSWLRETGRFPESEVIACWLELHSLQSSEASLVGSAFPDEEGFLVTVVLFGKMTAPDLMTRTSQLRKETSKTWAWRT